MGMNCEHNGLVIRTGTVSCERLGSAQCNVSAIVILCFGRCTRAMVAVDFIFFSLKRSFT